MRDPEFVSRINEPDLDMASNQVKFAKILCYIGEFQSAIRELLNAGQLVQATVLGYTTNELQLIATKQGFYECVKDT